MKSAILSIFFTVVTFASAEQLVVGEFNRIYFYTMHTRPTITVSTHPLYRNSTFGNISIPKIFNLAV